MNNDINSKRSSSTCTSIMNTCNHTSISAKHKRKGRKNNHSNNNNNNMMMNIITSCSSSAKFATTLAALLFYSSMDSSSTSSSSSWNQSCPSWTATVNAEHITTAYMSLPSLSSSSHSRMKNKFHTCTDNTSCLNLNRFSATEYQYQNKNTSSSLRSNLKDLQQEYYLEQEEQAHDTLLHHNDHIHKNNYNQNQKNKIISSSSLPSSPPPKVQKMASSIKHALNRKLEEYDSNNPQSLLITQSSRKYAISPLLPPPPQPRLSSHREKNDNQFKYHSNWNQLELLNRQGSRKMSLNKNTNIKTTTHNNTNTAPMENESNKYNTPTSNHKNDNDTNNNHSYSITKRIDQLWKTKNNNQNVKITSTFLRKQQKQMKQDARRQITDTIRNFWKKRNARSIEEGIRRGRSDITMGVGKNKNQENSLYNLLIDEYSANNYQNENDIINGQNDEKKSITSNNSNNSSNNKRQSKRYIARTISGLISALAEEATGVDVNLELREDTPIWQKHVDKLSIQFERLGIKQLKMGGLDEALQEISYELPGGDNEGSSSFFTNAIRDMNTDDLMIVMNSDSLGSNTSKNITAMDSPDEIFDKIDADSSGTLDAEELTRALLIASGVVTPNEKSIGALERLAQRLINLYDTNGDGVVDRDEYRRLVTDMTAVRNTQRMKQKEREKNASTPNSEKRLAWLSPLKWGRAILGMKSENEENNQLSTEEAYPIGQDLADDAIRPNGASKVKSSDEFTNGDGYEFTKGETISFENVEDISNDPKVLNAMTKGEGSIVLEDLKLDLRRLVFGAFPFVKKVCIQ